MNISGGPNNERNRLWKKHVKEINNLMGKEFKILFTPHRRYLIYKFFWQKKHKR